MQEYQVMREGAPFGKLTVDFDGLYCTIRYLCWDTGSVLRLIDRRDREDFSIGICGPISGGFGVEKKIPGKYMQDSRFDFNLVSAWKADTEFYPLCEQLPSCALMQLENCRYTVRNNKPGILIGRRRECTRCCP